jgi:uncharacterized protein (TIGR03435 family)
MPNLQAIQRLLTRTALALLLLPVAASAQSVSQTISQTAPPPGPAFEVAAIKPGRPGNTGSGWDTDKNRTTIENYTLQQLIKRAYDVHSNSQIIGGPDWLTKQHFDISAKIDDNEMARIEKMTPEQKSHEYRAILQSLLLERFHLKAHMETRPLPAYALLVNGARSKLTSLPGKADSANHSMSIRNAHMEAKAISMDGLAEHLSNMPEVGERIVINRTDLTGDFDFELNWTPDRGAPPSSDAVYPGLFTALREQLGLKVEPETISVPVVIVEAAAQPELD